MAKDGADKRREDIRRQAEIEKERRVAAQLRGKKDVFTGWKEK